MKFEPKHIIILVLATIFILKKIFADKPLVIKYNSIISGFVIISLAVLIFFEFKKTNMIFGIIALFLGMIALARILIDQIKNRK